MMWLHNSVDDPKAVLDIAKQIPQDVLQDVLYNATRMGWGMVMLNQSGNFGLLNRKKLTLSCKTYCCCGYMVCQIRYRNDPKFSDR